MLNFWLTARDRQPVPGSMFDLIRHEVLAGYAIRPDQPAFAPREHRPPKMSAHILSLTEGIGPDCASLNLVDHGSVTVSQRLHSPASQIVTVEVAAAICRQAKRSVSTAGAASSPGVPRPVVHGLFFSGFLGFRDAGRGRDKREARQVDVQDREVILKFVMALPEPVSETSDLPALDAFSDTDRIPAM